MKNTIEKIPRVTGKGKATDLREYIGRYLVQAENGIRKTVKGTDFAIGTLKSLRMLKKQFENYSIYCGGAPEFEDIDFEFRNGFLSYLYNVANYNVNTAAKCFNTLVTILSAAYEEGYHSNRKCFARQFRAKSMAVDSIFLTREELDAMMAVDVSAFPKIYETARDIFMIGVYTAQRVSDYNGIKPENILKLNNGDIFVRLRQKKTGIRVTFPARPELVEILEKYSFCPPHIEDRKISRCMKKLAKTAGIDTPVTIRKTTGGKVTFETHCKYELIQTHTARRTGATLMYLAGMNVFNICAVTGHSSIAMLEKYIKAGELERAEVIKNDAAFGRW